MEHTISNSKKPCANFLDHLDLWLGNELDAGHNQIMQTHHDSCAACRMETRLARELDAITAALPARVCPEMQLPAIGQRHVGQTGIPRRASQHAVAASPTLITRLLAAWRQPLVFVPALALILATLLAIQLRNPDTSGNSQIVIIDGQEYTQAEIMQATEDLKIALRYLDKYGSYPARVVQSRLEPERFSPSVPDNGGNPSI